MKETITIILALIIQYGHTQSYCGFDELSSGNRNDNITTNTIPLTKGQTDTIDIVFHLIHLGEPIGTGVNISDAQIESAILSLNRDFGAWSIHNNISVAPNGVNSELFFRLACVDPNGNPSNGINRVPGTVIPTYRSQGFTIKPNNMGNFTQITALSDWDIRRYINIWVVHRIETPTGKLVSGGALGANVRNFTQGQAGIFVTPNVVGCDPDQKYGFKLLNRYGKILSHEMGHYLGLLHTFEGNSCTESDCQTEGDLVCDTEPHDNSSPFPQDSSCSEFKECTSREPVENIMNYAGQECGNIFTQGQKDRMKYMINLFYQNLINRGYCDRIVTSSAHSNLPVVRIYPNPAKDFIAFETQMAGQLRIFDLTGKQVFTFQAATGKHKLSIDFLTPGFYLLKWETADSMATQWISILH